MVNKRLKHNQQGFVAITVALFVIALVTIITVSFAYLIRKEQKAALDRQLSTQAYYAAESGINDAVQALKSPTPPGDIIDCNGAATLSINGQNVDSSQNVKYTCVLINQSPTELKYDNVKTDESTVVHVRSNSNINTLEIRWQDAAGGSSGFAASGAPHYYLPEKFFIDNPSSSGLLDPDADFPNHIGILRTTITPASAATSTNALLDNSQTRYLYPHGNGAANVVNSGAFRTPGDHAQEGVFGDGGCNAGSSPRHCNFQINGINSNDFYVRLRAVYKPVAVTLQAFNSNVGASPPLPITGAQAVIDSTGKAQDVLRRIQVRVPLTDEYYYPEFAVESMDTLCKRFSAWPANGGNPGGSSVTPPPTYLYDGSINGGGEKNNAAKDSAACALPPATSTPGYPTN